MRNIWETNKVLHCSIAGFCMTSAEQYFFLKKCREFKHVRGDGMKRHHLLMDLFTRESATARQIQQLLNQKYRKEINASRQITAAEWIRDSESCLNCEQFGAFIWISAAHKDLNSAQCSIVFKHIHLFGHEMYFQLQQAERDLKALHKGNELLQEKYENLKKNKKEWEKEMLRLKDENRVIQCQLKEFHAEPEDFSPHAGPGGELRLELEETKLGLSEQKQYILRLEKRNRYLEKKLDRNKIFRSEVEKDFQSLLSLLNRHEEGCRECDRVDLCSKRVLVVGGLSKMKAHYNKLINKMGGRFRYHDGTCFNSPDQLTNLVDWSDLVLCPVDVNSHAACLQVKKVCKKTGKKYFMIRKSSISTIYKTLVTAADG